MADAYAEATYYLIAGGFTNDELSRLARTVRAWEAEILAFHSTKTCSNRPTEAVNLLITKVKRVEHGFRNFTNYRLACCYTAASGGSLIAPQDCEAAIHAWVA